MYQPQLSTKRLCVVFLLFIGGFVVLGLKLVYLQFFRDHDLSAIAARQKNVVQQLPPHRGTIYDRNLRPLALTLEVDSIYANPAQLTQKEKTAQLLSTTLGVDREELSKRLHRKGYFVWLKRWASQEEAERVGALGIQGIGTVKESKRFYPNKELASHVIGIAGIDGAGLEGVEKVYDHYLRGNPGWLWIQRDAKGRRIASRLADFIPPVHGYDVVLTIDEGLQFIVEKSLDEALGKIRSKGAMVVVMDPKNGDILALANRPAFDLNQFQLVDPESRRNRAVTDFFEPGSVFKIVAASAALQEKKVKRDQKFFCENGSWKAAGHILHDHKPHGWLTFDQVIQKSSNIGTAKVAKLLGEQITYRYIKQFGFGAATQIELPGEVTGIVKPPSQWSKTTMTAIPMGQEVTTTTLQLAVAFSVIANGGYLVRPRIVKEVRDSFQEPIKSVESQVMGRVLTPEVAAAMREILVGVVEEGTGTLAKIKGYTAGGKTGTAQKVEENGTYSHSKFVASFVGFAPADDPKLTICVIVDEPKPYYYGGVVSAPIFKQIAAQSLRY
ncbi:MAG: hypothetical protein HYS56_04195, partial [Candidatus Omnitrophica bacterium]|nr:hypothetical protein [Candidatus Omnitrophota bacterium]